MNYVKAQAELKEKYPGGVYFHNYLFPHNEKRTYRNKLTLVDENVKYLGVTIKDKTNRHWEVDKVEVFLKYTADYDNKKPEIPEKIKPKTELWFIYEIKGEKWYFKKEQPVLLDLHKGSKFLGLGEKITVASPTNKQKIAQIKSIINVAPKPIPAKISGCPPISRITNFDRFFCCYCEIQLYQGNYTREHLIPSSKGGLNRQYNLRPCCRECNTEKDNLMLHTYIQILNLQLQDKTGDELLKLQTKIRNANLIAKSLEHD